MENAGALRASTRDQYRWAFGKHILTSGLADIRLDLIRREDVLELASMLVAKKYKKATVDAVVRTLRRCLNEAIESKLIQENPVRKIAATYKQAPVKKSGPRPLTHEQALRFLEVTREKWLVYYSLFFTAIQTGLRSGELNALKWQDISLTGRAIEVRRNFSHGQINTPKTEEGEREVDMSTALVTELKAHRQALRKVWLKKGKPMPDWVFPSPAGNILDMQNLKQRQFKAALKAAELPDIAFHSLRDTFATLLLMSGQRIEYVSAQLGHRNIKVTQDSYAKWQPGTNRGAMEVLPAL